MEYITLRAEHQQNLRAERLAALEADHYRNGLVLEDAATPDETEQARRAQTEIERRMRVHRLALGLDQEVETETEADRVESDAREETDDEKARGMLAQIPGV